MYRLLQVKDEVRVPADKMGLDLEEAIERSVEQQYEGVVNRELGIVLAVDSVAEVGEGKMVPGDGAVYYPAEFKLLTYIPKEHEVVIGEVIDITEFGAFIRMGPIDGLVHISQVMNDYVSYDEKNGVLAGKESNKILKKGDVVRARVISVSFGHETKIGLTMRQDHLGAIHWLEGKRESSRPEEEDVDVEMAELEAEAEELEDADEPEATGEETSETDETGDEEATPEEETENQEDTENEEAPEDTEEETNDEE